MTMYFTALAVFFTLLRVTQGAKTRCQAPTVPEGSSANITCFFGEDVRLSRKNVKVLKATDTTNFDPDNSETVVECFWSDSQTFKCEEKHGYQLQDHQVTNKAVVLIPRVSKLFVGTYMCEAIPSDPTYLQVCELRIEEINDVPNVLMKLHEMQYQLTKLNEQKNLSTAIIIITAVTFITLHIGLVVFCNRRRFMQCFLRRGRKATDQTEEECVRLHDIDKNESNKQMMRETVEHAVTAALIRLANAKVGEDMLENLKKISEELTSTSPDKMAFAIIEAERDKQIKKQLTPKHDSG